MITQAELNDLFRDLDLPKCKAQFLGSKLQQWDLLENGVKVSLCRKRQENLQCTFRWMVIHTATTAVGWWKNFSFNMLLISGGSSSTLLSLVWRQFYYITSCSCSPHKRNLRQHSKFAARKKMVRRPKVKHICKTERCDIADWAARKLYEILLLPAWVGQPSDGQALPSQAMATTNINKSRWAYYSTSSFSRQDENICTSTPHAIWIKIFINAMDNEAKDSSI